MAHLNWKSKPIALAKSAHGEFQTQLELGLTGELAAELHAELTATFAPGGIELRVDLPENWTLYWRLKGGLSRLQVAHPQSGHWVGTVHLTEAHASHFLESLQLLMKDNEPVAVSSLGAMAPIVNFELVIRAVQP